MKRVNSIIIQSLKRIFIYLQSNYRSRLYKMHVFNAPNSIVLPWKVAKGFVEDSTREKLHFYKGSRSDDLWKEINPTQVEERFGGKSPNLKTYWYRNIFLFNPEAFSLSQAYYPKSSGV